MCQYPSVSVHWCTWLCQCACSNSLLLQNPSPPAAPGRSFGQKQVQKSNQSCTNPAYCQTHPSIKSYRHLWALEVPSRALLPPIKRLRRAVASRVSARMVSVHDTPSIVGKPFHTIHVSRNTSTRYNLGGTLPHNTPSIVGILAHGTR